MFKPVFEFLKFLIFSTFLLFLTGWLYGYHFGPVLRHLSVLFNKCSFATLVTIE